MWSIFSGTIVNVFIVAVGSLLELSISGSLPERYRTIVLQALGLITVTLGIDAAVLRFSETVTRFAPLVQDGKTYGARLAMVMLPGLPWSSGSPSELPQDCCCRLWGSGPTINRHL